MPSTWATESGCIHRGPVVIAEPVVMGELTGTQRGRNCTTHPRAWALRQLLDGEFPSTCLINCPLEYVEIQADSDRAQHSQSVMTP